MRKIKMFTVSVYRDNKHGGYTAAEDTHIEANNREAAMEKALASSITGSIVFCGEGEPWEWTAYAKDAPK